MDKFRGIKAELQTKRLDEDISERVMRIAFASEEWMYNYEIDKVVDDALHKLGESDSVGYCQLDKNDFVVAHLNHRHAIRDWWLRRRHLLRWRQRAVALKLKAVTTEMEDRQEATEMISVLLNEVIAAYFKHFDSQDCK